MCDSVNERRARTRRWRQPIALAVVGFAIGCGGGSGGAASDDSDASVGTGGSTSGVDPTGSGSVTGGATVPATSTGVADTGTQGTSAETEGSDTGEPPPPPLPPPLACPSGEEEPPAGALYVDPQQGDDAGAGSLAAPFQTLAFAFSVLESGDTLVLREGVYYEKDLELNVDGTEGAPVVIRAYPGETARIDGSLEEFRTAGNVAWELVDPSIDLYRSVANNYGTDIYVGKLLEGEEFFNLGVYSDDDGDGYADISSTVQDVATGPRYVGPGLYNQNGRLFVRLQSLDAAALHGRAFDVPADPDPRNVPLFISSEPALINLTGSFIDIQDLELSFGRKGIQVSGGSHHLSLERVRINVPSLAVQLADGVHDVLIDCLDLEGSFPPWVAWTDLKGGDGQSIPVAHWSMKTVGVTGTDVASIEVSNSVFRWVFDGAVMSGQDIRIHDSVFDPVLDDLLQLGSNSSRVEIDHNFVVGAGPSHNGKGDADEPGTKYVHHNVILSNFDLLWGKRDPSEILRPNYSGWLGQTPFPSHTAAEIGAGDPWKIYANTVVYDGEGRSSGCGIEQWTSTNSTGVPHEVYNNVLIETGGGVLIDEMYTDSGFQIYDGNLYFREVASRLPLWGDVDGTEDFASLAEFLASPSFLSSQSMIATGWEANGVEGDPGLDQDYAPAAGGPAASGAIGLPRAFPGERHDHRGALLPAR